VAVVAEIFFGCPQQYRLCGKLAEVSTKSGPVNAHFFLMRVVVDFSRVRDAFASRLKHPIEQFVFIFEETASAEDIAPDEREWG
jgi:hypothetical protein